MRKIQQNAGEGGESDFQTCIFIISKCQVFNNNNKITWHSKKQERMATIQRKNKNNQQKLSLKKKKKKADGKLNKQKTLKDYLQDLRGPAWAVQQLRVALPTGTQVQPLVRELRIHMLQGIWWKRKERETDRQKERKSNKIKKMICDKMKISIKDKWTKRKILELKCIITEMKFYQRDSKADLSRQKKQL